MRSAAAPGAAAAGGWRADQHEVLAELEEVRARLARLVARAGSAEQWSGSARAAALGALDRVAALVPAVRAPVLAAQQAAAARVGHEREFADTRARLTGSSRFQVATQVRTAETLTRLPDVRAAMVDGQVREGHVDVLARTLASAPPKVVEVLSSSDGQAAVVDLAQGVDAREFGRGLAAWVAAQDLDHHESERDAQRRARFLTLTHASDGTFLRGRLDPLAGRLLQRALDATGHRADEDRTPEQARADALTALAGAPVPRTTASTGTSPTEPTGTDGVPDGDGGSAAADDTVAGPLEPIGGGAAAHVSLLVPAETWVEVRRRQARRRRERPHPPGSRPASVGGSDVLVAADPLGSTRATSRRPGLLPAVTDTGTVLSSTELAAALCECAMTRVVMDAQGLPLDVGRTRRMFTPAQRIAVVARDRVCAWNGCSVPPVYGQLHHIAWWHRDGGASDLDNAVLLCGFHHHEVHRLDLDVEPLEAGPSPAVPALIGTTATAHATSPASAAATRATATTSATGTGTRATATTSATGTGTHATTTNATAAPTGHQSSTAAHATCGDVVLVSGPGQPMLAAEAGAAGRQYVFRTRSGRLHNAPATAEQRRAERR